LKLSLATFSSYLAERLAGERRRNVIGGASHVILVLGYTATISDTDHRESVQIVSRFKQQIPGNVILHIGKLKHNDILFACYEISIIFS
jgi:hypothetical protein